MGDKGEDPLLETLFEKGEDALLETFWDKGEEGIELDSNWLRRWMKGLLR